VSGGHSAEAGARRIAVAAAGRTKGTGLEAGEGVADSSLLAAGVDIVPEADTGPEGIGPEADTGLGPGEGTVPAAGGIGRNPGEEAALRNSQREVVGDDGGWRGGRTAVGLAVTLVRHADEMPMSE